MKRILFVDDDAKVLEGLRRTLRPRREAWQMIFAQSGAEALRILAERPCEVIVTDVRMPEIDGIRLLEHVQQRYPAIIRIVLSGCFEREAALRASGVAHRYLAKPCDAGTLGEAIESLCRSASLLTDEAARSVVSAIGSLPSPPQTYTLLKRALEGPDLSLPEVSSIIEQDVGMTAKVLQLVNSPLFGLAIEVTSVRQALDYIGLATLKQLALSVEIFQAFDQERPVCGFSLEAFQSHCRLAARIAAQLPALAEVVPVATMATLLHDVGKLVLAARLPEPFERALRTSCEQRRPLHLVEQETIGTSHAEIGAYLLSLWKVPQPIVHAVRYHHQPAAARPAAAALDVLGVTHVANALAVEVVAGVDSDAPPAGGLWDLEYLEVFGMTAHLPAWRQIAERVSSPVQG